MAADTQEKMVCWTRECRETADRMEATDERRAGQVMTADRHIGSESFIFSEVRNCTALHSTDYLIAEVVHVDSVFQDLV